MKGWYPDPWGAARWRYWDGHAWTSWTDAQWRNQARAGNGHAPAKAVDGEIGHLDYLVDFVDRAEHEHRLTPTHAAVMRGLADRRRGELAATAAPLLHAPVAATTTPATTPLPPPAPAAIPTAAAAPPPAPYVARPAPPAAPPPTPSTQLPTYVPPAPATISAPPNWWSRLRTTAAADLSMHGLAYLGVLLIFAGVFGTVVWGFRSFSPQGRAWVELAIPVVLLVAAWLMRRAQAKAAATALSIAGGLVLPLVALASLLDGAAFPPDADDPTVRLIALVAIPATLALVYAVIGLRRAESGLRYVWAPVAWLAVAMAALPTVGEIPDGFDVATPHPWQTALMAWAVPATLLLVRLPRLQPLRAPTVVSSVIGLPVVLALCAAASAAEEAVGWPLATALAAGVVSVELLADRLAPRAAAIAQLVLVVAAWAVLAPPVLSAQSWGLLAVAAALGLAEWIRARRGDTPVAVTALVLGVAGLPLLLDSPGWPAIVTGTVLAGWGFTRFRAWPDGIGDAAFVAGPLLAAAGVNGEFSLEVAATALTAYAAVAAAFAARSERWSPTIGVLAATGIGVAMVPFAMQAGNEPGWPAAALLLAAIAIALSRRIPVAARAWASTLLGLSSVAVGAYDVLGLTPAQSAIWLGAAATLVVLGSLIPATSPDSPAPGTAGHVQLAALGTGLVAVALAASAVTSGPALAALAALSLSTVALLAASLLGRTRLAEVITAWTLPVAALLLTATTALVFADFVAGDATLRDPPVAWLAAATAATAFAWTAVGRVIGGRSMPTSTVLIHGGAIVLLGSALAVTDGPQPLAASLTVLAAAVLLPFLLGGRRTAPETGLSILLSGAWLSLVVDEISSASWVGPAAALGWGAAVSVAVLAVATKQLQTRLDSAETAPVTPTELTNLIVALVVTVIATATSVIGWAQLHELGGNTAAIASLAAAILAIAYAWVLRLTQLTALTWALVVDAFVIWLEPVDTGFFVAATVTLLAVTIALQRLPVPDTWPPLRSVPRSWAIGPFAVANLTALSALTLGADEGLVTETYVPIGALSVAVGVLLLRRKPVWQRALGIAYAVVGAVLILAGIAEIGPWWQVGALAVVAGALTIVSIRLRDLEAWAAGAAGAFFGAAAWANATIEADASTVQLIAAAALSGGAVTLVCAAPIRLRKALSAAIPWAGLGLIWVAASALGAAGYPDELPNTALFVTAGLLATAVATFITTAGLGPVRALIALPTVAAVAYAWTATTVDPTVQVAAVRSSNRWLAICGCASYGSALTLPWAGTGMTTAAGLLVISLMLSDGERLAVAIVLIATTVVLTACGLLLRRAEVLAAAPVTGFLAWAILVDEYVLGADAAWYSIAGGLALLVVVAIGRWHLRAQDSPDPTISDLLVALDWVGMLVLVSVPVLRSATDPWSLLLAVLLGAGLIAYGLLTRVRRRLLCGAVTVPVSVAVALVLPLVGLVRDWGGWALWLALGAIGLLAIAAAGLAERRRGRTRDSEPDRWQVLTSGWE